MKRSSRKRRPVSPLGECAAYLDLADAVLRSVVVVDGDEPPSLRVRYTIGLGTLEGMIGHLLEQLTEDGGSVGGALAQLGVPTLELVDAWVSDVKVGLQASVRWLATNQNADASSRIALTPSVRALRGDDYLDLAEAVGHVSVMGDGALDPARLRRHYTIERAPWLRMVSDLLGQVVGDAGSVEHAATVLGVKQTNLTRWVRWFVSRGSADAACSRWPLAAVGDEQGLPAYLDLLEAVERGALDGDNAIDAPSVQDVYMVRLDSWERMESDLLEQVVADAGSARAAAKVLDVPRSTLSRQLGQHRERRRGSGGSS